MRQKKYQYPVLPAEVHAHSMRPSEDSELELSKRIYLATVSIWRNRVYYILSAEHLNTHKYKHVVVVTAEHAKEAKQIKSTAEKRASFLLLTGSEHAMKLNTNKEGT